MLSEYTYIVKKVHEFKPVVNVGSTDNYHLSLSHISQIAFNMLRRWLKLIVLNIAIFKDTFLLYILCN